MLQQDADNLPARRGMDLGFSFGRGGGVEVSGLGFFGGSSLN